MCGHKAADTELTYAPVSQAYGLRHKLLTCCFAVPLKRGPNVALSSPPSAAIECFLARLDRPTNLHPPVGRLGRHPRVAKSDDSTAGQPGPGLEPVFCGVCVQCISGLLLGRHQYNRFPNRLLPFPNLPPQGSNCPSVHISNPSRRQGRPHRLHGRLRRTWPPTQRAP